MSSIRSAIHAMGGQSEREALSHLLSQQTIDTALRNRMRTRAIALVKRIRAQSEPTMMELFLGEYGLSSEEGVALMCLAEALLRVPDDETVDALIEDKIAPKAWDRHLGQSHSSLINASTWALFMTGKVLNADEGESVWGALKSAVKRLGEPVIRQAVTRVMKELGQQFVLGETIQSAMQRAKTQEAQEAQGFTYSYDMLGEAACTEADARRYCMSYSEAIGQIAKASLSDDIRENPGISVKLSALHPRYETLNAGRVMDELLPRARSLAILAKSAGIGFNLDAEEAGRLEISLDLVEALLADPALRCWDGFGVVIQAYGLRAPAVIDWLYALAQKHDRKIMVRLVKGAYWDTEIKHAQTQGLANFPVFTRKEATDVSYIACAQKLLGMTDRLYPQFATHNAHTVAAILEMADDKSAFEFQRLHGMGEALHKAVLESQSTRCRIYAPVGAHRDLLAYLVRRLLENGANSSFVNQIVDETVPPEDVAADPFARIESLGEAVENPFIRKPSALFAPGRENSKGWDLEDPNTLLALQKDIALHGERYWDYSHGAFSGETVTITNPANHGPVGRITQVSATDARAAIDKLSPWTDASPAKRGSVLRAAADLYEENAPEIFSLLMREAGKTLPDCVGELREAVDFLRYYAFEAQKHEAPPAGVFACISPWNFPLAIFTGQMAAALASGNGVVAKPAETTPLIAAFAVGLMKRAGVPERVLHLVPGTGVEVGGAITSHPGVSGVCFTGSTNTAQSINRVMAHSLAPHAPLIAETGGLNAMIVDSTALPEQAVKDVIQSAFQSAGQRCSALRVLYLQRDIAEDFLTMLSGAMDELALGDPMRFDTDIGPVIDAGAKAKIDSHIERARLENRLIKQLDAPSRGTFVGPALLRVSGIGDLEEEIFGPVLHVATYDQSQFETVIAQINATGYGLTFGMHSRIDDRVQMAVESVEAGNIYINRNQIGAVVGSQPFGGEGLSGTGPKAGGPQYLKRFYRVTPLRYPMAAANAVGADEINAAFHRLEQGGNGPSSALPQGAMALSGPTGESNRYFHKARNRVLCLGPSAGQAQEQASLARSLGCNALAIAPGVEDGLDGTVPPDALVDMEGVEAVIAWTENAAQIRRALAQREGPIVPLYTDADFAPWLLYERHVCVDTTAAGGNAALLAGDA
ncbi:MAG: bifunctional proline dehydrogenase/L-glutamate gamma-semialdehyde dehydrogenase PutA [Pseudomonadota bacterium]